MLYAVSAIPDRVTYLTDPKEAYLTYSPPEYGGNVQAVYIRGINVEENGTFWPILKGCLGVLVAFLLVQALLSFVNIESFTVTVENAMYYLKHEKIVDAEGVSQPMFQSSSLKSGEGGGQAKEYG